MNVTMQHNRRFLVLLAIEKNVIIELQMEMIKRVSPVAMRRGWTLQQSGQVHVTTSNSDVVQGEIYGKETYYVQLKLDDFVKSSCTCSRKGYCLHMAAVFFQLYAKFEKRTELFLMQHQQMRLQMQQERRKKKQASDKKQQTSVWTQPLADISDRSSFRDWQLDFEKKFAGYFNATMQHVTPFHEEADKYVQRTSQHWRSPMREMYQAFAQLFMLALAEGRYLAQSANYEPAGIKGSFMQLFQDCVERFGYHIHSVSFDRLLADHPHLLTEATDYIHQLTFGRAAASPIWLDAYRHFIWKLAASAPSQLIREQQVLEKWLQDNSGNEERRTRVELGWHHVRMVREEGSDATRDTTHSAMLKLLLRQGELPQAFTYLQHFAETRQWGTLKLWLNNMLEAVRARQNKRFSKLYLQYWNELNAHVDVRTDRLEAMRHLLPYSYEELAAELLKRKQYEEWVKLQMAAESSPLTVNRSLLKEIEAKRSDLLVPFYHQSIDRYIQEKKRESYRQAVLLIDQLRLYYERQGEAERFVQYVNKLVAKYHVLRAFREELGRSNLRI